MKINMKFLSITAISLYNLIAFLVFFITPTIFINNTILLVMLYTVYVFCGFKIFYRRIFKNSCNVGHTTPFVEHNTGKVGCYVINLDKAIDRFHHVMPQVQALKLPVEKISAVDGAFMSEEEKKLIPDLDSYKIFFRMLPELGTIGCALSHEKALKRFMDTDNEFALIFEDDALFEPDELADTVRAALDHRKLWDIVGFELNHHGAPQKIVALSDEKNLVAYLTNVKHTGCYLINRNAAHKLLQKFYPIKMPFDHYFSSSWEFDIRFAGVEPRIVKQAICDSQIKTSNTAKVTDKIILLENAIFQIKYNAVYFVHNFLYWLSHRS